MNPPLGHATLELKPDGTFKGIHDESEITTGTWEQTSKDELLLKYVSHNHGTSKLKIVDADHLTGANVHPNGKYLAVASHSPIRSHFSSRRVRACDRFWKRPLYIFFSQRWNLFERIAR